MRCILGPELVVRWPWEVVRSTTPTYVRQEPDLGSFIGSIRDNEMYSA
jgi:hypothetical protein